MKILVVSNFYPPHVIGGAEIIAHQQALALARRGHEIHVLAGDTTHRSAAPYQRRDEIIDGLPVTRIALQASDFAPTGNNVAHPQVDRHFQDIIAAWKPDVIHAHHLIGLSLGILSIARAQGIRIALTLHDHWGFCINSTRITTQGKLCQDASRCDQCHPHIHANGLRLPQRMRQDYLRWQLHNVDHFISPSHYLADAYINAGLPAERIHVIANGIELERFAAIPAPPTATRLKLLFIGYMGPHKGLPSLIEALALLPQHQIHIDFVGEGHERNRYKNDVDRIARHTSHPQNLTYRFWGRQPNQQIAHLYAQTQLFILPSVCPENQPVTITEAMASGRPVIASRIGGIPELVTHGRTGRLTAPGDAADLATQIEHYIKHPEAIQNDGKAARERIQAFAFNRQIEQIESLLAAPAQPNIAPPPLIATHGDPLAATLQHLKKKIATADPAQNPCWIPANWVEPEQAAFLWVATPAPGDPEAADTLVKRYCEARRPVLIDERNIAIARSLQGNVLTARGAVQNDFIQAFLLQHPDICFSTAIAL